VITRQQGVLYCEGVSLLEIAKDYGTPTYVYSAAAIANNYQRFAQALAGLDAMIGYAVKSQWQYQYPVQFGTARRWI